MTFNQTLTYLGSDRDHHGAPHQWFHYLAVAHPVGTDGAATVKIMSLAEAIAQGVPKGPVKVISVSQGGPEAALKEAESYLDLEHAGLHKHAGDALPHGE
jgi:hypothetical protein